MEKFKFKSKAVAWALQDKIIDFAVALEKREKLSPAHRRHLMRIRTLNLIKQNREKNHGKKDS